MKYLMLKYNCAGIKFPVYVMPSDHDCVVPATRAGVLERSVNRYIAFHRYVARVGNPSLTSYNRGTDGTV